MAIEFSERVKNLKPSVTLAISSKAKEMKAQGIDVISFGAGEPDFEIPDNVKSAAKKYIEQKGSGKYGDVPGLNDLKQAISKKFEHDNKIKYDPSQIIVNCGAKHSLYNIIQVLVDKGDEVIIPSPYWVTYPVQVQLAEGTPVFAETGKDFKLKAEDIEKKITEKTKAIILNSPNNPSGAVIEREELEKIADLAVENNVVVISDEIYEKIVYGGKKLTSIASFNDEIKNLTITVNGLSKSHSMPGWRIGYCAGPKEVISKISALQGQSTSNVPMPMQYAALEALTGSQDFLPGWISDFYGRRNEIVKGLNKVKGFYCNSPEGAFYVFPDISRTGMKSMEFSDFLLKEARVAVVPGIEFGNDNCIRLSYATSMHNIQEGVKRIKEAVEK